MDTHAALLSSDEMGILARPEIWTWAFADNLPQPPVLADLRHARWLAQNSHAHRHPEIMIALNKGGMHSVSGKVYRCEPGAVFVFGPFDRHDQEPPPHHPDGRQLWFGLHGNRATAQTILIRGGHWRREWACVLGGSQDAVREWQRCLQADAETATPAPVKRLRLKAVTQLLVAGLLEGNFSGGGSADREVFQRAVIAAVCEHIEETAGCGDDLAGLARFAGYSKFHFARLFKRFAGTTVHSYIDMCRLQRARDLMGQGVSQAEVARVIGFSSPQSFCRWFRDYR